MPNTHNHHAWLSYTMKKSFDSVETLVVMKALGKQGVEEIYGKVLKDIYKFFLTCISSIPVVEPIFLLIYLYERTKRKM